MKFEGKKVAVVGYGVEGKSSAEYLAKHGAKVTILDQDIHIAIPAEYESKLGPGSLDQLDKYDLIVRSPGVRPDLLSTKTPVTTATSIFLERCKSKVIGVTGTKGKGTTSTLISKILEASGKRVWLGGNIGTPKLDFLDDVKTRDVVVLELSSFQLMDVKKSPNVAVILKIEQDHLNWHRSMDEYIDAKAAISKYQKDKDVAIYHYGDVNSQKIAQASRGKAIPYLHEPGAVIKNDEIVISGKTICWTSDVGLIGPHNLENICAAATASWLFVRDIPAMAKALSEFKGLEHRLELVMEHDGVKYYNDSFATSPGATIAALRSFSGPKVLILGGVDKNIDFSALIDTIKQTDLRKVLLIGETAPRLKMALESAGFSDSDYAHGGMENIVKEASTVAKKGDVVLLSPACSSFDMFENYKDRGDQFREAVRGLQN